jgi:hypothetical protein
MKTSGCSARQRASQVVPHFGAPMPTKLGNILDSSANIFNHFVEELALLAGQFPGKERFKESTIP